VKLVEADVLVCGGGMAGSVAALTAARFGARTLLVERWGFLGGSATAAAVGQFVGWETEAGQRVIQGAAEEIVERLVARGASSGHGHFTMSTGHRMDRVEYDPEALKLILDEMLAGAGAQVLFHATVMGARRQARVIEEVTLLTKAGPLAIRPKVVIDATGDLDLLAAAGAGFLPLEPGEQAQPATMMFRFGPIDFSRFGAVPTEELAAVARRGVEEGALARAALHCSRVPGTLDGWFNISRVAVDATDPFALSRGEAEGRRQAFVAADFLTRVVPGCEAGRLVALAPQLGIRESRRIHGLHVLTDGDLRERRHFPDAIAAGAYPIDIHPATDTGLRFETLGAMHAYEIPYRCLVPRGLANALTAGRGISATHTAHAATRVMPTVMAIGQAAGVAASTITAGNVEADAVEAEPLRQALRRHGAYLP
jgi:FAD dependent oxidoreductase